MPENEQMLQDILETVNFIKETAVTKKEFKGFEGKVDKLDKRVDGLDKSVDKLNKSVDGLDKRVGEVEKIMGGFGKRMGGLEVRMTSIEIQFGEMAAKITELDLKIGEVKRELEEKIDTKIAALKDEVISHIDALAHSFQKFEVELVALKARQDRLEENHRLIAKHINLKLST